VTNAIVKINSIEVTLSLWVPWVFGAQNITQKLLQLFSADL